MRLCKMVDKSTIKIDERWAYRIKRFLPMTTVKNVVGLHFESKNQLICEYDVLYIIKTPRKLKFPNKNV